MEKKLLLEDPDRRLDPVKVEVIDIKENRVYFNTPEVNKNWSRGILNLELDGLGVLITNEIVFHDFFDNRFYPLVLEGSKDEKKGDAREFSLVKDLEGVDKAGRKVKYLELNLNQVPGHHVEDGLDMLKYFIKHSSLGFFNEKNKHQNVTIAHGERVTMADNLGQDSYSGPVLHGARNISAFTTVDNLNILRFEAMYESDAAHYLQWKYSELHFSLGNQSKIIGVIRNPWKNKVAIILSVVFSIIFVLLAVIGYLFWKNKKQKETNSKEMDRLIPQSFVISNTKAFQEYIQKVEKEDPMLANGLKKLYIPNERIKRTERILGKGQFGVVSVAIVDGKECCVKTCRADISPPDDVDYREVEAFRKRMLELNQDLFKEIFKEAFEMARFEHENIMKCEGVSLDEKINPEKWLFQSAILIILPLMDRGDALTFIRSPESPVTYKLCMQFAMNAADGMDYLSTKNVIHRDLAARNCLLESNGTKINLRISDFGLAKHMENAYGDYDQYSMQTMTKLPIKWLAPEVLKNKQFTTMSDVWAFGILIWEIFTRGLVPYGPQNNWKELEEYLQCGRRLDKPDHCDDELYDTLLYCWQFERQNRPSFKELSTFFREHYKRLNKNSISKRRPTQLRMPQTPESTDFEIAYGHEPKSNPLSVKSNQIYEVASRSSIAENFEQEVYNGLQDYVSPPTITGGDSVDDLTYVEPKGLNSAVDI
ncbi:Oidioi.mRNA.OKI2018_I69.chr1.g832.t1.cds [Oikopleura dioica]|uniref:Oidioi.mRNA.OKI2018_I69.chr1.g832.t1.cds n=1 Tax=Oikopleura dioica TaxID=34765 RepID=A0ABN7SLL8_OIKDI|nr:Oidioi.mRNA.OKI2018_I69.chr1.g832.t1.cds [Oikopleura dioica]